ncbi:hypothetical protein [Pseudovibrio sp. Tun.PSC04-5.I4]|uniref:hypothetical protein n=1 Tax=Pseudovibrio sp. Tun.PSC04-5.I4 TaxID=1798213 RepID=UPI000883EAF7|nr:hypothetical protein [Pseudovibrio sp. Tun.PSC04-5.I4]SDR01701.1 hypothetical protein SAMN04515695_2332 [Pseudovibrio sp. Tun.PSC04-5.I4]
MSLTEIDSIRTLFDNADSFLILGALIALYIVHHSRDTRMSNLSVLPWLLFWLLLVYSTHSLITGLAGYAANTAGEIRFCSSSASEDCTPFRISELFNVINFIAPQLVLVFAIFAAYFWRSRLRLIVLKKLKSRGIWEPEFTSTQQIIFLTGEKPTGQVAVHTSRGTYLSIDLAQFEEQPHGGVYLGSDGAIAIHVTHVLDEETKMAKSVEQTDPPTLTIFPASEIEAIEVQH